MSNSFSIFVYLTMISNDHHVFSKFFVFVCHPQWKNLLNLSLIKQQKMKKKIGAEDEEEEQKLVEKSQFY